MNTLRFTEFVIILAIIALITGLSACADWATSHSCTISNGRGQWRDSYWRRLPCQWTTCFGWEGDGKWL